MTKQPLKGKAAAGQKGGKATKKLYGKDHFKRIGRIGGQSKGSPKRR